MQTKTGSKKTPTKKTGTLHIRLAGDVRAWLDRRAYDTGRTVSSIVQEMLHTACHHGLADSKKKAA
jgi:predicted DNA-binding protein